MSTITGEPRAQTPVADWIPSPLARFTVDQYEAMVDSGVFTERDRFQLINGLLVAKVTKKPPHVVTLELVRDELMGLVSRAKWRVMVEAPIRIPDYNEPEPDLALAQGTPKDYSNRHPGPADLAMVVEVADSSIALDRQMARVYGPAGIPVYWIVNLAARQVEVYTLNRRGRFGKPRIFKSGKSVPVVIDGASVGRIAVDHILPPIATAAEGNGA